MYIYIVDFGIMYLVLSWGQVVLLLEWVDLLDFQIMINDCISKKVYNNCRLIYQILMQREIYHFIFQYYIYESKHKIEKKKPISKCAYIGS